MKEQNPDYSDSGSGEIHWEKLQRIGISAAALLLAMHEFPNSFPGDIDSQQAAVFVALGMIVTAVLSKYKFDGMVKPSGTENQSPEAKTELNAANADKTPEIVFSPKYTLEVGSRQAWVPRDLARYKAKRAPEFYHPFDSPEPTYQTEEYKIFAAPSTQRTKKR